VQFTVKRRIIAQLMTVLICALALISFSGCGLTSWTGSPKLTYAGEDAFEHLVSSSTFAVGYIGLAGVPSEGGKALDVLLREHSADYYLQRLVMEGSLEGKLYGLFGLSLNNNELFQAEIERITANPPNGGVTHMSGCIVFSDSQFVDVMTMIEEGVFDSEFEYLRNENNFFSKLREVIQDL
jgi:hypothetical protein